MSGPPLDVLAVGELNPDLIMARVAAAGPVLGTEQEAGEFRMTLGSSTAICAVALRRLGLATALVARTGDDEFGRFCRAFLEREGVDTGYLKVDEQVATGVTVSLTYPADRLLVSHPGAMARLAVDDVPAEALSRARHLHVASFFLQVALQPGLAELLSKARARGLTTSLDTGYDPRERWDLSLLAPVLAQVDYFLPNEVELRALARTANLDEAAAWALGLGVGKVVVKRSGEGSSSYSSSGRIDCPAFPVSVVDTTGAGDSFDAGYLFGALAGLDEIERLRLGNACGAIAAGAVGGTEGLRDLAQARRLMTGGAAGV